MQPIHYPKMIKKMIIKDPKKRCLDISEISDDLKRLYFESRNVRAKQTDNDELFKNRYPVLSNLYCRSYSYSRILVVFLKIT